MPWRPGSARAPLDLEYHANGVDLSSVRHETSWVGVNIGVDIDAACPSTATPALPSTPKRRAGGRGCHHQLVGSTSFSKSFPLANDLRSDRLHRTGAMVLVPNWTSASTSTPLPRHLRLRRRSQRARVPMSVHWDSANGFSNGFSFQPAH
jgi:hypothetical protein